MRREQIIRSRKNKLTLQFKDMLYSLSSAVGAGNSVERALFVTLIADYFNQVATGALGNPENICKSPDILNMAAPRKIPDYLL